jgi:hypothetical protein
VIPRGTDEALERVVVVAFEHEALEAYQEALERGEE